MKTKEKQGISLIVLVITIIVIVILAVAVILSIANNNPIENARNARDKNDDAVLKESAIILSAQWMLDNKGLTRKEYIKNELKKQGFSDEQIDRVKINEETGEISLINDSNDSNAKKIQDPQIVADLFSVAQTYKNKVGNLTFNSSKTAYDSTTTNEIDCSSFLQLVLSGVPYENSKYNGNSNNVKSYDYGIELPDNPYADRRWLANDIAHYAYDNNFAFYPNSDVSNVMPGDVLFFKTNGGSNEYFMGITHASIVVQRMEGDKLLVFHGNNTNVVGFQVINLFSEKTDAGSENGYCNGATLIARFPLNKSKTELNNNNLFTNGEKSVLNHKGTTTTCIKTLLLSQSLKPNTAYTMLVKMHLGTEEYPDIFPRFVANSYSDENKITNYISYRWVDNDEYLINFITNDTITVNNIKIYMISKSNIENKYREGSFYSAKLYEGMFTKEQIENLK